MADYDKHYQTENLFGNPYPELIDFFRHYEPKGRVLDLGCGQGRDAIPLAKLGYDVTGIDTSKVGINQLAEIAKSEGLNLTGSVGDIYFFDKYHHFDIVLLDSMLHFEKGDKKRETDLILKIARQLNKNGLICFCIQDTGNKVKTLKETLDKSGVDFYIIIDSSLVYTYEDKGSGHKSEIKYCMYIVRKK